MAKYPGLLLWTDAWIADTHHLSVERRGAYMDLLILMWRTPGCRVPNDDHWLAHHLRYTADQITTLVRPVISEFCTFAPGGDFVVQKRLQREFAIAHSRKEKAASAIRARWAQEKIRKQKSELAVSDSHATKKADALVIHSSPSPSPAPAHFTVQVQSAAAEGPRSLASALPTGALAREAKTESSDPPEIRQTVVDRVKTAMADIGFEFKPEPISNPENQSSSLEDLQTRAAAINGRMLAAKRSDGGQ